MREALLIGNNEYKDKPLKVCLNDLDLMASHLRENPDKSQNFDIEFLKDEHDPAVALAAIKGLFSQPFDVALLYFSGHGSHNATSTVISFYGDNKGVNSINLLDILNCAVNSPAKQKVIILDSCYSGGMGTVKWGDSISVLSNGISIITACNSNETAKCDLTYSKFTEIFCYAMEGAAADYAGRITLAGLYSFVEKFFGDKEQRPLFKTNTSESVVIKRVEPRVATDVIERTLKLFMDQDDEYKLDSSYEHTNYPGSIDRNHEPYANAQHVSIFKDLQALVKIGLVVPTDATDMYFAAMDSKSCHLTPEGKFFWKLVSKHLL